MEATPLALMSIPGMSGTLVTLPSNFSRQAWKPEHDILQSGFGQFPALHFQVHCGCVHTLWHGAALQLVVQAGGLQRVLHFGHSPLGQSAACNKAVGHKTAHFGLLQRVLHLSAVLEHNVSHLGGKQSGSQD